MEDEKIDEEIWSVIRYLDPDKQDKSKEVTTTIIIATLVVLLIVGSVCIVFWLRLRQP